MSSLRLGGKNLRWVCWWYDWRTCKQTFLTRDWGDVGDGGAEMVWVWREIGLKVKRGERMDENFLNTPLILAESMERSEIGITSNSRW